MLGSWWRLALQITTALFIPLSCVYDNSVPAIARRRHQTDARKSPLTLQLKLQRYCFVPTSTAFIVLVRMWTVHLWNQSIKSIMFQISCLFRYALKLSSCFMSRTSPWSSFIVGRTISMIFLRCIFIQTWQAHTLLLSASRFLLHSKLVSYFFHNSFTTLLVYPSTILYHQIKLNPTSNFSKLNNCNHFSIPNQTNREMWSWGLR